MLRFLYPLARPLLFRLDAETVHEKTMAAIDRLPLFNSSRMPIYQPSGIQVFGRQLVHPLGLAGGFDKEAVVFHKMSHWGFSFIETGTFTPRPQPGNPRPRLFRVPSRKVLLNRMGFNSIGIEAGLRNMIQRLPKTHESFQVAISIGKNKDTALENAADDYLTQLDAIKKTENEALLKKLFYIAVNISSPNTPGLRKLQNADFLNKMLKPLVKKSEWPVVVKFAPDFSSTQEFTDLLKVSLDAGAAGIIVTNTTVDHTSVENADDYPRSHFIESGAGLSGEPLRQKALDYLSMAVEISTGVPVISSGGVMNGSDVQQRLRAGATLVQAYTGFIYGGPGFAFKAMKKAGNQLEN